MTVNVKFPPMIFHRLPKRKRGFTLLELLIAISVFAILSVVAYSGLRIILDTGERTKREASRLSELQKALTLLQRDIEQTVSRPIRDDFGDTRPTLVSNITNDIFLELSRTGWNNPLGLQRSTVQRVGYRLFDGDLFRITWPVLDRPQEPQFRELKILHGVSEIGLRFFDVGEKTHDNWPPVTNQSKTQFTPGLPIAIEIKLQLDDWGEFTRLFRVAGG